MIYIVFSDSSTEEITVVIWTKDSFIALGNSITSSTKFPWDHEDDDSKSALINQTATTTPPVQSTTGLANLTVAGSRVIPGNNMFIRKPINVNMNEVDPTYIIAPVVFMHRDYKRRNSSISILFNISGPNVSSFEHLIMKIKSLFNL